MLFLLFPPYSVPCILFCVMFRQFEIMMYLMWLSLKLLKARTASSRGRCWITSLTMNASNSNFFTESASATISRRLNTQFLLFRLAYNSIALSLISNPVYISGRISGIKCCQLKSPLMSPKDAILYLRIHDDRHSRTLVVILTVLPGPLRLSSFPHLFLLYIFPNALALETSTCVSLVTARGINILPQNT